MRTAAEPRPKLVTPAFVAVTVATLAYFLTIVGMIFPILPRYVEGPLGGGAVAVGFAVGTFAVAAVAIRPFAGRLADRFGRRPLIMAGAALGGAAVAGYIVADSLAVLIPLRVVSGFGEALFFTGAATAINDLAPDERRGEAVSLFSLALYAALAFGPFLGEMLLARTSFDVLWAVAAGGSVVALLLALRVPDTRPEGGRVGGRLLHGAAVVPGIVVATSIWGFAGFTSFVPLYALQVGLSGSRMVFMTYALIIMSIRLFGARIPDRFGAKRTATVALAVSATGLAVMWAWGSVAGLFLGVVVFSAGQALAFPALMSLAVASGPVSERGAVIGTFTMFVDVGFGLGPVTLGVVAAVSGYQGAFLGAAVVALAGMAVLRRQPERRPVTGRPAA